MRREWGCRAGTWSPGACTRQCGTWSPASHPRRASSTTTSPTSTTSDLSWDAEDAVIQAGHEIFAGLPAPVQIRNQARVHLWYEQKFGIPCPPHDSTEAAIDTYEATTACLGVRQQPDGRWRIYAPHGLADVFNLVVRPNPVLAPLEIYEAKTTRWRHQWPGLTVLLWPQSPGATARTGTTAAG